METSSTPKVEGLHDRLELAAGAMLADLRLEMIRVVLAGPELIVVSGSTFRHGSAEGSMGLYCPRKPDGSSGA